MEHGGKVLSHPLPLFLYNFVFKKPLLFISLTNLE